MRLTSYLQDGTLTVALTGEIDHHCAKDFISAISAKIEAYTPKACVLDFREVTFMDSSGIAVTINALRSVRQIGGDLEVCGLRQQPFKVFKASGIDKLIHMKELIG